jgi:hypothetical protein
MLGFLVGAVAGGVAVWLYREQIQDKVGERSTGMRARAADTLETLQHRAESVMDRAKGTIVTGLRAGQDYLGTAGPKAESAMDRARDRIVTGLRAGQDYLRTPGAKAENGPVDTLP